MTTPAVDPSSRSRRLVRSLLARWPSALALAMSTPGFLTIAEQDASALAGSLGQVLVMLPLGYLVLAKLRRRWATWPVVLILIGLVVGTRLLDVISPSVVLGALALLVLIWAAADRPLHTDRGVRVQALGLAGFGAVAVAGLMALATHPDLGTMLVAAGWLLHGGWDFVHLRSGRVVARSFAEWCMVIDTAIAVQLILITWTA